VLGSGEGAENRAEKVDAVSNPETVRAMLEDYRAGLTVDAEMDRQDRKAGRRITCSATTFAGVGVCEGFTTDDLSAADPGPRAVHARGGHAQRGPIAQALAVATKPLRARGRPPVQSRGPGR
jgi:hypothetical protein